MPMGAATNIKDVLREYALWCQSASIKPLPVKSIATAIGSRAGPQALIRIEVEKSGKDYIVVGVSLKALAHLSGEQA
jgi:hypothetical protein